MNHIDQYVIFKLENEYYGITIDFVETIEKVSEITRLPNAPIYIKGVINLRGEVIPVIDLRIRFGMDTQEITDESRIIILSYEEMVVGILVDSSSEVLTINSEDIDNSNTLIDVSEEEHIKGIGKVNGRMIIILDVMKVLAEDA
ncbi:MAG: purine-binding chemotaxis protein CheW [Clostridiales bacterium]|nr:purine-binding chemotaxis protein CheW [Clostridiales bacterium]